MSSLPGQMTGTHYVRVCRSAFADSHALLPSKRDRGELRRQALKLRYFGQQQAIDEAGSVVDLNWSWIKALRNERIAELRIDDRIGGHDNLRVIIFHLSEKIPAAWDIQFGPVPMIWILAVLQKKRDDFTRANCVTFSLRRALIVERFYVNSH